MRLRNTSFLPLALRVDEALVDIVDHIRGRSVERGGEVRHERGREARQQEADDARRDVLEHDRQHLLEVGVPATQLRHAKRQGEDRDARDHHVAREHEHERHHAVHQRRLARIARGQDALHIVVRRRPGQAGEHALEEHQAEDDR
jgi:hypothetical protein